MNIEKVSILAKNEHMNGMQHIDMLITSIAQPFSSIMRIRGKIATDQPELWSKPNLAIRIHMDENTQQRPISRIYTVRSFNNESSEIEIDFVIHADLSPAMLWLKTLQLGQTVSITGPRLHINPNFNLKKKVVMFADDTAIPALYSILQQWPKHITGELFIESCEPELLEELPKIDGLQYHFFLREQDQKAGSMHFLIDAAKRIAKLSNLTCWAACERMEARLIRSYFLEQHCLKKEDVSVFGYWKAGVSSSEIDEVRLAYYAKLVQKGQGLEAFDDLDVTI